MKASPPQRATGTFTLACGLLAIDLAVYSGTEETRVARHEYVDGDPTRPVGRAQIDKTTGELIETSRIVKMCTATSGAVVAVSDEQLLAGTLPSGECEVVTFVPVEDAWQYVTEGVYQLRPKARGTGKDKRANVAAEKAFAVVLAGMAERQVWALVRYSLRGPARYGLLTYEGDLYPCCTTDQVRERRDLPAPEVTAAEVAMVQTLIEAIGISTPIIVDETARQVQEMVDGLAAGIEPLAPMAEAPVVVDLMASLMASVDAAKASKPKRQTGIVSPAPAYVKASA